MQKIIIVGLLAVAISSGYAMEAKKESESHSAAKLDAECVKQIKDFMKNEIIIDYLKNHPEHVITCAQWSFSEWGHYTPQRTLENFIESRKEYLNDDTLPLTLLAFDGKVPVGMCSLGKSKDILPQLLPWIPTLYVVPEYRGQGVGSLLEAKICEKARDMGYNKIYCYTSDTTVIPWYEKLSWRKKSTEWLRNHYVTVMEKDLG